MGFGSVVPIRGLSGVEIRCQGSCVLRAALIVCLALGFFRIVSYQRVSDIFTTIKSLRCRFKCLQLWQRSQYCKLTFSVLDFGTSIVHVMTSWRWTLSWKGRSLICSHACGWSRQNVCLCRYVHIYTYIHFVCMCMCVLLCLCVVVCGCEASFVWPCWVIETLLFRIFDFAWWLVTVW